MRILQIIRSLRISFSCYFSAFGYNVLLERVIKMKARQLPPYEELSIEERERLYEHGLHDLEKHGYIRRLPRYRESGSRSSNLYVLVDD